MCSEIASLYSMGENIYSLKKKTVIFTPCALYLHRHESLYIHKNTWVPTQAFIIVTIGVDKPFVLTLESIRSDANHSLLLWGPQE